MTHPLAGPRLGLALPPAAPPEQLWPAVELAEAGGLASLWVTDRTVSDMPWLDALTALGALAARTTRMTIGTSVLCVARRNPVLTAHALASAQWLSGGRVVAGVGLGGLRPVEFELAGVPLDRRAAVTDEYLGLLRRLWSEDVVEHAGTDYACSGVGVQPHPQPMIPLWLGGNSPGTYRRVGRLGDGWLSYMAGPAEFAAGWAQVTEAALEAGRDPSALTPAAYLFGAIARRSGEAEAALDPLLRAVFGTSLEELRFTCVCGSPEQWADTVGRFGEAGVAHVVPLLFTADLLADVELVVGEVLPRLVGSRLLSAT